MACAGKLPLLRAAAARTFSSAQPSPASSFAKKHPGFVSTVLPNKIFVASLDNGSPSARITVAYKAGSRNEPDGEPGLTHVLRIAAGNTTEGASNFAIVRNLQQIGANLTVTCDRETILYTLEASKYKLEDAVKFLNDVASRQTFKPWELEDNMARVKYEIGGLSPQVRAIDLLHKAAYRRGLGNSAFCPPRRIGKISSESLQHFVSSNFTSNRCAVGAVGISLERAVAVAQTLNLSEGNKQDNPSPYKGGELRKEMGGELTHIAMGLEGVSLSNFKEAAALAILSKAIASGPKTKWGGDHSPLAKAIAAEVSGAPFAVNGLNISYSDTGLFGVLLSITSDQAGKAVQVIGKVLKGGISSVGSDALKKGRAQLQMEVLCGGDTSSVLSESLAAQGVLIGALKTPAEAAEEITKITDSDIMSVAGKITRGKISMGAAGALVNVPYVDELQ